VTHRARRLRTGVALVAAAGCLGAAGVVQAAVASPLASAPSSSVAPAEAPADWTLMIYDVADTQNIADDMIRNLAAFTQIPDMSNVNVVALVDLPERSAPDYPRATLPGVAPFSTAKLLVLGGGRWNEVRDYGEVSMGRADVLSGFIEEAAGRFPADKYGLVMSDHGNGADGGYYDVGAPGIAHLTVADMRAGVLRGMQAAGIDEFEFIDHDACLMANYETASALGPLTRYMVASEEITFGSQTLSNEALASLGQDIDGAEWGRLNNEAYATYADRNSSGWGKFTATSVIDGQQMTVLDDAVESFALAATKHMDEIAPELGRARSAALEFVRGLDPDGRSMDLIDLGDFLRHVRDVPDDVAVARDAVFAALDRAVVDQQTRQATQQATGLNVFFPKNIQDPQRYIDSRIGPPGWTTLLSAYLDAVGGGSSGGGAGSGFVSDEASILEQGPDGILVAGQLRAGTANNLTGAETQVHTQLGGRSVLLVDLPAYVNSGAPGQIEGSWGYQAVALSSGGSSPVPVSTVFFGQAGGLIGSMFAHYEPPSGFASDVEVRLLLTGDGKVAGLTVNQGGAPISLNGGVLTPYDLVLVNGKLTYVRGSTSLRAGNDLQVSFPRLADGTAFDIGLVVTDVNGSVDGAFVSAKVQGGGGGQGRASLTVP